MKVSIIMPFKNAAEWIFETTQSILDQSYQDWELIAIDDHSTDDSWTLINEIQDNRIRVITNKDSGIIPALQLGLSESSGDFITRMDADDLMPEKRLHQMVELLSNSSKKTVVTGYVKYFPKRTISEGYQAYENWINERVEQNDHWSHIYRECVIASPNWMCRKSDLVDCNIFDLNYPEDYDMVFRWYKNGFNIQCIRETTLLWREHPERTSRNSDVYDQASFFELKLNWFLQLHYRGNALAIFGAGTKGKIARDFLIKREVEFNIYDIQHEKLQNVRPPSTATEDIALICVYPENKNELEKFLDSKNYVIGENAWYL